MKKITKKTTTAQAPRKRSARDLAVKPVKGGSVRGGLQISRVVDKSSAVLYQKC